MSNSILDNLQFDRDRGALVYKDVRYLLIRPETLCAFQKAAEEQVGTGADELLYAGGYTGGTLSAKKYRELFGLSDAQSVEFMANMATEIGWGRTTVTHFDRTACELDLQIDSSPFAVAYGASDRGVCHLVRGVFAGLASGIFGRPVEAREQECVAMGHTHCKVLIRGK